MTFVDNPRVEEWKETFRSCVLQRGALHVRFPVSSMVASEEDKIALQKRRLKRIFAPLIGEAERAIVVAIGGDVGSLREANNLSELLDCGGSVCELNRDPAVVGKFSDFFADRFRVDAKRGIYQSLYPPYAELICIFSNSAAMPLEWIKNIEGISLWNLGCLKTPLKGLSPQARQIIGAATRKRRIALAVELGHAGTSATLYIPTAARENLIDRIFRMELET